jgi:hypothetical protein
MPMIPCILSPSEAFPSASLVFFFFCFVLETLLDIGTSSEDEKKLAAGS